MQWDESVKIGIPIAAMNNLQKIMEMLEFESEDEVVFEKSEDWTRVTFGDCEWFMYLNPCTNRWMAKPLTP